MARQRFHSKQPNYRQVKTIETTMTSQFKHNYSHYEMAVEEDDGIELGNVFIIVYSFVVCVLMKPITLKVWTDEYRGRLPLILILFPLSLIDFVKLEHFTLLIKLIL